MNGYTVFQALIKTSGASSFLAVHTVRTRSCNKASKEDHDTEREQRQSRKLYQFRKWRRRQWIMRRIRRQRKMRGSSRAQNIEAPFVGNELTADTGPIELDLPPWAITDQGEKYCLGEMKRLLEDDFGAVREKVVDIKGTKIHVVEAFPDVYSDLRLLRFLRKDSVQDPTSAANRYRKFLWWRQENRVDYVRAMVEEGKDFPYFSSLAEYVPSAFELNHLVPDESAGSTIPIVLWVGQWRTSAIADLIRKEELRLDEFLDYWTFLFEALHRDLYRESLRRQQMVYVDEICDLSKLSIRQFSPGFISRVLEPWVTLSQSNYPETTKRIMFVNPPRIISFAWNIVAPFISPGTLAKVKIVNRCNGTLDFVEGLYD